MPSCIRAPARPSASGPLLLLSALSLLATLANSDAGTNINSDLDLTDSSTSSPQHANASPTPPAQAPPLPNPRSLIVGGTEAPIGRYPYSTSLSKDGTFSTHLCGGSLIAPDLILTAAHCAGWPGPYLRVDVDQHDLNDRDEEHEWFMVRTIIKHPEHDLLPDNYHKDLAIAKLYGYSTLTPPVKLNRDDFIPASAGESMTVFGWGYQEDRETSNVQFEVDIDYVPNDVCMDIEGTDAKTGRQFSYGEKYINEATLCGHDPREGACLGDSGGPLVLRGANGPESDVQVGVVSFGLQCGHEELPGVYARVSAEMGWITDTVCALSSDPPANFGCPPRDEPAGASSELVELTVTMKLGAWKPYATGWLLESADGRTVYAYKSMQTSYGLDLLDQIVTETVSVPDNAEYRFVALHVDQRGFCCGWWGNGYYEITREGEDDVLLYGTGDFETYAKEEMFTVGNPPDSPTDAATDEEDTEADPPPPPGTPFVTVVLTLEYNSDQVAWAIKAKDGTDTNGVDTVVDYMPTSSFENDATGTVTFEEVYLLPPDAGIAEYTFVIYNVNEWNGKFELYLGSVEEGELLYEGDGDFDKPFRTSEEYDFAVEYPEEEEVPTPAPTPVSGGTLDEDSASSSARYSARGMGRSGSFSALVACMVASWAWRILG